MEYFEKVAACEDAIMEKQALFEKWKQKRAAAKEQRQERMDKAIAMGKEMQPIEDAYVAGKINYNDYYNKINSIAKKHGQTIFVSRREPGQEWKGYKINKVAAYEDAIMEKVALNKMDKVFTSLAKKHYQTGTGNIYPNNLSGAMSSDLYKRGLSTAFGSSGTKGATGRIIAGSGDRASAISNIRNRSNDVLPRKQYGIPGTKDWKPFAPHSGNTGLSTVDPSNTSRGYARNRYNTLLAKNKARLGQ